MTTENTAAPLLPTRSIRVFHCTAMLGSMSKAATELHRAQSAVQRSIQQLEDALGVSLFERTTRGILLTEHGKILQQRSHYALEEMATIRDALYQESGERPRHNAPIFSLSLSESRLAILMAFAEHRYMGTVALRLNISQSAVSMALRDLEDSTGLTLFDRSTTPITLTGSGQRLLAYTRRALYQLRLACMEISAHNGALQGQITIGALPFARPYILPTAIASLHARHPNLQFASIEGPLETLTYKLWCGDLDLVLGALSSHELYPDLILEELFKDQMVIISRPDHPLAQQDNLAVHDLHQVDWVLPPQHTPTRECLQAALSRLGAPLPKVTVESTDLSLIRGILLGSDMITAVSRHLFQHELRHGLLRVLPVTLPATQRTIGVLRRAQSHSSPGAQQLLEDIRALGNTLGMISP